MAILVSIKILPVSASHDKERTCLLREIGPIKPVRHVRSGQWFSFAPHLDSGNRLTQARLSRLVLVTLMCIPRVQGYLAHKKTPTPLGLSQDPKHWPTVGSWGEMFSYT